VNIDRPLLRRYFQRVSLAARFHNSQGVENDEEGAYIWLPRTEETVAGDLGAVPSLRVRQLGNHAMRSKTCTRGVLSMHIRQRQVEVSKLALFKAAIASAVGARAVGALAVGAGALGALAIARLHVQRAAIEHLSIENLEVGHLRVRELEILQETP
jgi:hypothetical protein